MEMFARAEPTKVLMIDDDIELSQMTSELLLREGIQTHCAVTAALGMAALATYQPDVLLLDLMLPDANGLDVCRRLRESGNELPILMLTARGDPIDRVLGLELGADDYLAKPFEPRELVARVRALARRVRVFTKRTQLQFDGLSLDLMARRAICTDPTEREPQILQLTSNEFKLLVALASQPGITVSRDALSAAVQPGSYMPLDRAVDVQVARLRKKLRSAPNGRDWIETVRGEGYVFTGSAR
ncbi:DNA-binding response OmpR family regulator [Undibacterium sp. GrIS 1.2]|uniref:response regulator transcription factor n=1 Tax=Undibacterium sp. GrIS 1.2 TaxID=3143933 RepID=UPI0033937FBF